MATFILFGKYSADALKGLSAARTKKAAALVKKLKGKIVCMYALLGEKDLVFILELPGMEDAMKASVGLFKLTGITFTTSQAIAVDQFDKLMSEI
ncbi:MAG TPA: GYD domain-containing protein [Deltaproteobacteria bacterium]|nr:GYD domain-containing protein [Deltaproteobacteria bacterium]HPR54648.1 GYD domain-containing protein [Deltaproteobacteria bacterium]HXK47220.1 GYD domain-containing protein [Deltaproteobacteria bacterium]